jgi:hypothetical protein
MRHWISALAVVAGLAVVPGFAQEQVTPQFVLEPADPEPLLEMQPTRPAEYARAMFDLLDTNADGVLDTEEFKSSVVSFRVGTYHDPRDFFPPLKPEEEEEQGDGMAEADCWYDCVEGVMFHCCALPNGGLLCEVYPGTCGPGEIAEE